MKNKNKYLTVVDYPSFKLNPLFWEKFGKRKKGIRRINLGRGEEYPTRPEEYDDDKG